jgi:DNA-binding NtrC family response regulator
MEILVVDDDGATRQWLGLVLEAEGYVCHRARNQQEAESWLHRGEIDLALVDIYLGSENGVDFLRRIKALQPNCDCVMMTAHASVETMAQAVKDGAVEYLSKPLLIDDLLSLVRRLEKRRFGRASASRVTIQSEPEGFAGTAIIGRSPKMLEVYRSIARVAPTDATVLIVGPSGSGKERVARAIHAHSQRAAKPITAINCGALAESVLESELFGHEKGAFTGADIARRGLFENSGGGTIFLDEISETTTGLQVTLLRVLQERQIRRLGSNVSIPVDVRILAATNADLGERIRNKQFRDDLYYRLSVLTIQLPSLEERREDIPLLVRHFLRSFNQRNGRRVTIREDAVAALARRAWPGNVRELENVIERAAILSATGEIAEYDIDSASDAGIFHSKAVQATQGEDQAPEGATLKNVERRQIARALREAHGNRSLAARTPGIGRKTLYKKALRLGVDLDAPGE